MFREGTVTNRSVIDQRTRFFDLESYKKYSPYTLINNEVDFISKVVNM